MVSLLSPSLGQLETSYSSSIQFCMLSPGGNLVFTLTGVSGSGPKSIYSVKLGRLETAPKLPVFIKIACFSGAV